MNISDWLLIAATVAGPILAVQAQKWVERATENRRRRLWIFETIMANRATRLADENIRALNQIDLVFRRQRDRAVISAWRSLFGELTQGLGNAANPDGAIVNAWNNRCNELYVALESAMSTALGFSFTDEELRRGIYYPRGHVEREQAQLAILHNLKRLLIGETAINMNVKEFPVAPETAAAQAALFQRVAKSYTDDGTLRISVVDSEMTTPSANRKTHSDRQK
jgi:hypothetical protein